VRGGQSQRGRPQSTHPVVGTRARPAPRVNVPSRSL
jgi:hypothetical protein